MRVLVIDTALGLCTAAVFEGGRALAQRSEAMAKGHQERIGGMVRDVVAEAGGFQRLDRIGVTTGPGSFTGLRVGLAFAQGLGAALDRPVVGLSTLAALAVSVGEAGDHPVAAAIDARRGKVYLQPFLNGAATGAPEAVAIPIATARLTTAGPSLILVGSGAPLLSEGLADAQVQPLDGPTPNALAALTVAADPEMAPPRPLYLRAPDATPPTRLPGQPRPDRMKSAPSRPDRP